MPISIEAKTQVTVMSLAWNLQKKLFIKLV